MAEQAKGTARAGNWRGSARAQGIVLLGMGILCVALAILLHPINQLDLLALGVGLFIGWAFDTRRMFIPATLITLLGLVNVLWQYGIIRGGWLEGAHLIAIGLALVVILLAARRGALTIPGVGANPITPGILIAVLGITLVLLGTGIGGAVNVFVFGLWLPALVFLVVGIYHLLGRS